MLLATPPLGTGAAASLGRVFPVEAERHSTVQLGSHAGISGELQKI